MTNRVIDSAAIVDVLEEIVHADETSGIVRAKIDVDTVTIEIKGFSFPHHAAILKAFGLTARDGVQQIAVEIDHADVTREDGTTERIDFLVEQRVVDAF